MSKLVANAFLSIVAAASMLTVSASNARADEEQVVVKVPFDFVVGAAHLPAGTYTVREASIDHSVISIINADGREGALAPTFPAVSTGQADQPELVFEKIHGQYFLARVVSPDGDREIASMPAVEHQSIVAVRQ